MYIGSKDDEPLTFGRGIDDDTAGLISGSKAGDGSRVSSVIAEAKILPGRVLP
jgi:hypothetical protein